MIDIRNQNPLIRRAFMALEDGKWAEADKHCEEALNQEPENAYAYLGKLMARLHCCNIKELSEVEIPFTKDPHFEKCLRFSTVELQDELRNIDEGIIARVKKKKQVQIQKQEERKKKCTVLVIKFLFILLFFVVAWYIKHVFVDSFIGINYAKVGDTVLFGYYGDEPLEWKVLDVQGKKKLLITSCVIDCKKYNAVRKPVTWKDCTLRKWLNEEFYNKAFNFNGINVYGKGKIVLTKTENNTYDMVFCLNAEELHRYGCVGCKPTLYAKKMGVGVDSYFQFTSWWLRDNVRLSYEAPIAFPLDDFIETLFVDAYDVGVRPALWVNMEKIF